MRYTGRGKRRSRALPILTLAAAVREELPQALRHSQLP